MRKTTLKPLFQMSYSSLLELNDSCLYLIDRDASVFTLFGIGEETVTFLTDTGDELRAFRSDEEFLGDMSDATETRDQTADKIKVAIRDVMLRPRMIFGENTAKYRSFGTLGMDAMNDKDLLHCSERVVRAANQFFDLLEPAGLTHAIVDSLDTLSGTFREKINLKIDAVYVRDIGTEERIEIGNKLYNKIVILFDIGKTYWADKSEAKYNDYVIYNTPTGAPPPVGEKGDAEGIMVNGATNQPIVGGLIVADGVDAPAVTNVQGAWNVDDIPTTTTVLRASAPGMGNLTQAVNLSPTETAYVVFVMWPVTTPPPPTP